MTKHFVYLKNRLLDEVYFDSWIDSKDVKRILINHNGMHPEIEVRYYPKKAMAKSYEPC